METGDGSHSSQTVLITDRDALVRYAMSVLRTSVDWQEAQTAIANHPRWSKFAVEQGGDEGGTLTFVQAVISDAEERLGDDLPY